MTDDTHPGRERQEAAYGRRLTEAVSRFIVERVTTEPEYSYTHYFIFPRRLITGEKGSGVLTRWKEDGKWVYRRPTEQEQEEMYWARQW